MKSLVLITGTNEVPKYVESLRNLNLGEVQSLQYDLVERTEQALYAKIKECAPDFVVYIGARWGKVPAPSTLATINDKIAPMVHICSDAADYPWHDLLREYDASGCFALQVAIDGSHKWPLHARQMTALTPVDPAPFPYPLKRHSERIVPFGYAGNPGSGPVSRRTIMLSSLLATRMLDLRIRSNLPHTYEAYCTYLSTLRVSLNVAYTGTEATTHVKGRVIESALAGACLLETKGSPTSYWFRPGIDYLEYETAEDAIDLVKQLGADQARAQAMADSMMERVKEHSPALFWQKIFDRIGMKAAA